MQARWDPDDYQRNALGHTAWATRLLILVEDVADVDLVVSNGYPVSSRPKPDGIVEVPMVRLQAVAGCP